MRRIYRAKIVHLLCRKDHVGVSNQRLTASRLFRGFTAVPPPAVSVLFAPFNVPPTWCTNVVGMNGRHNVNYRLDGGHVIAANKPSMNAIIHRRMEEGHCTRCERLRSESRENCFRCIAEARPQYPF